MKRKRKPPTPREAGGPLMPDGLLTYGGSLWGRGFLPKAGSLPRDGAAVLAPQGGSR